MVRPCPLEAARATTRCSVGHVRQLGWRRRQRLYQRQGRQRFHHRRRRNDTIDAGAGDDTVYLAGFSTMLQGGSDGQDVIDGGAGNDSLRYDYGSSGAVVNLATGSAAAARRERARRSPASRTSTGRNTPTT